MLTRKLKWGDTTGATFLNRHEGTIKNAEKEVKLHTTNTTAKTTAAKHLDFLLLYNNVIFFLLNLVYCSSELEIQTQSIQVQPENGTMGRNITNVIALRVKTLQQLRT